MPVRRAALRLLIVSIVVSGVLAITVLIMPATGRLAATVLLSALATSGASICGMACGAAWDRGRWSRVALAGLVVAGVTLALTLVAFWIEPEPIETWMKFVATGWLVSVAAAHTCLLALAPTDDLLNRIRTATIVAAVALAAGIALPLWVDQFGDSEPYQRGVGVVAVLMLMGSLGLPVAARLRGLSARAASTVAAPQGEVANVMCPACSHVQSAPLGHIQCEHCETRYRIELETV